MFVVSGLSSGVFQSPHMANPCGESRLMIIIKISAAAKNELNKTQLAIAKPLIRIVESKLAVQPRTISKRITQAPSIHPCAKLM